MRAVTMRTHASVCMLAKQDVLRWLCALSAAQC